MDSLFRDGDVFDSEYLPEVVHFRDLQLESLIGNLHPALDGSSPVSSMLLGPPSTGKTCVLMKGLNNIRAENVETAYIRCPLTTTPYRMMVRVFECVCGHQAPQTGYPMIKLYDAVCEKLVESGRVLIVALDDMRAMDGKAAGEVIYTMLKAVEEYAVKVGVIVASSERVQFDPMVSGIFQPAEIHFPLYTFEEMNLFSLRG